MEGSFVRILCGLFFTYGIFFCITVDGTSVTPKTERTMEVNVSLADDSNEVVTNDGITINSDLTTKEKCEGYCDNGGTCDVDDDGNPFCVCKPGYDTPKCKTGKCVGYCQNDGSCKIDDTTGNADCDCTPHYTGPRCETTCDCGVNGNCSFVNGSKICTCNDGYAENDGICKVNYCFVKCGIKDDVECIGDDKFDASKTKCACKDPNKEFFWDEKICITDYCLERCGRRDDVECVGNDKFDASKTTCVCKDPDKAFFWNEKICKIYNCKDQCNIEPYKENFMCTDVGCIVLDNEVYCVGHPFEAVWCVCEDKTKVLDPLTKGCRECDCGYYGKCIFKEGRKECLCYNGFEYKNGICTVSGVSRTTIIFAAIILVPITLLMFCMCLMWRRISIMSKN